MARAVGRQDMYSTVYRLQCTVGHTNARSMNEYVVESEEGVVFNIGPNWPLAETSLVILFDCYFHIVKEADAKFGWSMADQFENLAQRYSDAVKALRPAGIEASDNY